MKKIIRAAAADEDTRLRDMIDSLEDDFDYIVSGLEKLDRSDRDSRESAIAVATELHEQLNNIIASIADIIGG